MKKINARNLLPVTISKMPPVVLSIYSGSFSQSARYYVSVRLIHNGRRVYKAQTSIKSGQCPIWLEGLLIPLLAGENTIRVAVKKHNYFSSNEEITSFILSPDERGFSEKSFLGGTLSYSLEPLSDEHRAMLVNTYTDPYLYPYPYYNPMPGLVTGMVIGSLIF